jgi:simple sugar transport system permease protein
VSGAAWGKTSLELPLFALKNGVNRVVAEAGVADAPAFVGIPLVVLAAMAGGALWAGVAGLLRAYRGINEVIVTLLMNFIAIYIVSYMVSGPLLAKGAPYPYSEELATGLHLPILMRQTDTHIGILFGLLFAVVLHLYFKHSARGFAFDVVGRNSAAARYAGIAVERQIVIAMAAGGALAGLGGAFEIIGLKYRLFHMFSAGYGFDGIVVAFMAGVQPLLIPLSGIFIAGLKAGAGSMQRGAGVDGTIVEAIQGLIVMFVAAGIAWKPSSASILAFLSARGPLFAKGDGGVGAHRKQA